MRAMHIRFLEAFEPAFRATITKSFTQTMEEGESVGVLQDQLWTSFVKAMDQTSTIDPNQRFSSIVRSLQPIVLSVAGAFVETVSPQRAWTEECSKAAIEIFEENRESYSSQPDATPLVGLASRRMYAFV